MNKLLLNVDCQNDFITGSLAVKGAVETTDRLISRLLDENDLKNTYKDKFFTLDWHPFNHVSFKEWLPHCIQHTVGAAIYPPLFATIYQCSGENKFLTKGNLEGKDEYSVFKNYFSGNVLVRALERNKYDEIHVCGIAGDFCVFNTIKDLIELGYKDKIVVLLDCTASIDGGTKLMELIKQYNLKTL